MVKTLFKDYEDGLANAMWKDSSNDNDYVQMCIESEKKEETVAGGTASTSILVKSQPVDQIGAENVAGSSGWEKEDDQALVKLQPNDETGAENVAKSLGGEEDEKKSIPAGSDPLGRETNILFSASPWDEDYFHHSSPYVDYDNLSVSPLLQYPDDDELDP